MPANRSAMKIQIVGTPEILQTEYIIKRNQLELLLTAIPQAYPDYPRLSLSHTSPEGKPVF